MIYYMESGVDQGKGRRYLAGLSALLISAALPILSTLIFRQVSKPNPPATAQVQGTSDSTEDENSASSDPTNNPSSSEPSNAPSDTSATVVSAPTTGTVSVVSGSSALPSSTSPTSTTTPTVEGGRGNGSTVTPAPVEPQPCSCSSEGDEGGGISAGVGDIIELEVDTQNILDSSLEIQL
jgi:cytoskeletal protein RodZ